MCIRDSEKTDGEKKVMPSKIVDLEAVAFKKGGHTMTNKTCDLANATRKMGPGWEEIHVPAPPAAMDRPNRIQICDLPECGVTITDTFGHFSLNGYAKHW